MGRRSRRVLGARPYHNYSDGQLERALEALNNRSLRDVSREFGIPIATLSRKKRGICPGKYGGQNVLSAEEETQLVEGIKAAGVWGFPLTAYDIKMIVKNYLDKKGVREKRFIENTPGRRWIERFLHEHKNVLSGRNAENIKRSRAEVSEEVIKNYFFELEKSLEGVPPSHIMNYDETNFTDDPGKKRVIVKRGAKHPERCVDSSKASVSVMMAGTADGVILPPYIVYKSEHLYDTWRNYGPKGARYNRSKSGWFDTRLFEDWFYTIVIPFIKTLDDGPKVMIGDNLSSHISMSVIADCKKYNIRFILLLPNSTHLCQPLDVSFFHPLKVSWRKQLDMWKMKNRGCVPKDQFPSLLRLTMDGLTNAKQNLISGFSACGIHPFDSVQVLKRLPSWINQTPTHQQEQVDIMNSTFLELLESMRYPIDKKGRTQHKKRLDVAAGRSIVGTEISTDETCQENPGPSSVDNIIEEVIHQNTEEGNTISPERNSEDSDLNINQPSTSKNVRKNNKKKRKVEYCSSDSDSKENMNFSVHDSSSDYECLDDVLREETSSPISEVDSFSVGDFLLVEFKAKGKKMGPKCYVGVIIEIIKTDLYTQYYCKFMRKVVGSKTPENTFVFPSVDDLSIIDSTMIKMKLSSPKIWRGHHTFDMKENI